MSSNNKKLDQIRLQHEIGEILRLDNGVSCHFDYHVNLISEEETVKLNLLTYNKRHDEYMLMHTVKGSSSIDCLKKMLAYVQSVKKSAIEYSFTVYWKKTGDPKEYTSYFRARTESEAKQKFLYEKNPKQYNIRIEVNPVS
jgi:hypothetical protein